MSLRASVPAESDMLCEFCGYILNGLDDHQGNCPECGTPMRDSIEPGRRLQSPIEREWSARAFWQTTLQIIFQKRKFFRETQTRASHQNVPRFGRIHRRMSGILFGLSGAIHAAWMAEGGMLVARWGLISIGGFIVLALILAGLAIVVLNAVTRLASWLTTKEATFWGMRLPALVVQRTMSFHAANYLPVAVLTLLVVAGYRLALLLHLTDARSGVVYLITLCVLVVAAAIWLFESYVIAMRRIRLANF